MREILFRGKRIDNGEWIVGDLVHDAFDGTSRVLPVAIQHSKTYPVGVIPETVGQFVGLRDKNNVPIFEGDILSDKWLAKVYQNDEGTFMVRFHANPEVNKPMRLKIYLESRERAGTAERDCTKIGNIHEHPHLLNCS